MPGRGAVSIVRRISVCNQRGAAERGRDGQVLGVASSRHCVCLRACMCARVRLRACVSLCVCVCVCAGRLLECIHAVDAGVRIRLVLYSPKPGLPSSTTVSQLGGSVASGPNPKKQKPFPPSTMWLLQPSSPFALQYSKFCGSEPDLVAQPIIPHIGMMRPSECDDVIRGAAVSMNRR